MSMLPSSYSTDELYSVLPQFLQDADTAAGSPLYLFLYGICQILDTQGTLFFDDMGAGITISPIGTPPVPYTLARIASPIAPSDISINIFGTDATWNQIVDFIFQIEDEQILIIINYLTANQSNLESGTTAGWLANL